MARSITITLAGDTEKALNQLLKEKQDLSLDEVVDEALKEYLFVRRFRSLREKMLAKAQSRGVLTDQDVFERIS